MQERKVSFLNKETIFKKWRVPVKMLENNFDKVSEKYYKI